MASSGSAEDPKIRGPGDPMTPAPRAPDPETPLHEDISSSPSETPAGNMEGSKLPTKVMSPSESSTEEREEFEAFKRSVNEQEANEKSAMRLLMSQVTESNELVRSMNNQMQIMHKETGKMRHDKLLSDLKEAGSEETLFEEVPMPNGSGSENLAPRIKPAVPPTKPPSQPPVFSPYSGERSPNRKETGTPAERTSPVRDPAGPPAARTSPVRDPKDIEITYLDKSPERFRME